MNEESSLKPLIRIGEMLHASIPSSGPEMKSLHEQGEMGLVRPSRARDAVIEIITAQALQGADYIDINIDALEGDRPEAMRRFVELVHSHGQGVPPSIDSSDPNVLTAGLQQWIALHEDSDSLAPTPLVNSIPHIHMESYQPILNLRKDHAFGVVCLLMGLEGPLPSIDAIVQAAREMFRRMKDLGFESGNLFFDAVTLGMASDGCVTSIGDVKPSHTRNSFEAIRRIRSDEEMAGVHCVLGVSNWAYGTAKRRVGHIRAFIEVAMRYGLDAAIVDVSKDYGKIPAPSELVEFVEMFVSLDGDPESMLAYSTAMRHARESGVV